MDIFPMERRPTQIGIGFSVVFTNDLELRASSISGQVYE